MRGILSVLAVSIGVVLMFLVGFSVIHWYQSWDRERVEEEVRPVLKGALEWAYMQGQIDALEEENLRIESIPGVEGEYRWVESPWDDPGSEPVHSTSEDYRKTYYKGDEQDE